MQGLRRGKNYQHGSIVRLPARLQVPPPGKGNPSCLDRKVGGRWGRLLEGELKSFRSLGHGWENKKCLWNCHEIWQMSFFTGFEKGKSRT